MVPTGPNSSSSRRLPCFTWPNKGASTRKSSFQLKWSCRQELHLFVRNPCYGMRLWNSSLVNFYFHYFVPRTPFLWESWKYLGMSILFSLLKFKIAFCLKILVLFCLTIYYLLKTITYFMFYKKIDFKVL